MQAYKPPVCAACLIAESTLSLTQRVRAGPLYACQLGMCSHKTLGLLLRLQTSWVCCHSWILSPGMATLVIGEYLCDVPTMHGYFTRQLPLVSHTF